LSYEKTISTITGVEDKYSEENLKMLQKLTKFIIMINWIKNLLIKLNERRKRNIKFRKEFKEKTGVDLNDIHIGGGGGMN
jgi:hypothetical protein